jgi:hypothetical protein
MAAVCKQLEHLVVFFCPGCKYDHCYDKRWAFNGNFEKPTFIPSLLVNPDYPQNRCHLFMTDGKIQFLGDCHHDMKNQTVEMQPYEN